MRIKSLDDINGNEILADDIRSGLDFILVPKGTKLKTSYVSALKNLGITEVLVKMDSNELQADISVIPKEVIDCFVNHLSRIYEKYKDGQGLSEVEILSERIVDFCKDNPMIKLSAQMNRTTDIFEHSIIVSLMCVLAGIKLDIIRPKLYQMVMACLIHDFALLSISCEYCDIELEELDEDDQKRIMEHSKKSYEIVVDQQWITQEAKEMILSHHERMNGRGYPYKKTNHSILCRVIQVADAFDGMLSGIEYRKKSFDDVMNFLESHKTCRYDRTIVEIICQLFAK